MFSLWECLSQVTWEVWKDEGEKHAGKRLGTQGSQKSLPKFKDLSSNPSTHVKLQAHAWNPRIWNMKTDGGLEFSRQPRWNDELQAPVRNSISSSKCTNTKGYYLRLICGLCLHPATSVLAWTHIHTHTCNHTQIHIWITHAHTKMKSQNTRKKQRKSEVYIEVSASHDV